MCCSHDCTASFLQSRQGPASPGKDLRVGRGYNVSCACSVQSCTVPVAVPAVEALRTYHGIILFLGPMKALRAGVMGRVVGGPAGLGALATKGVLGGTPFTSWFTVPRLVRRPVHVPWPKFFFFFSPTQHCIALRVAREVR